MESSQSNSLTWDSYSSKESETQELLKLIFIQLAEIKEMLANGRTNENLRAKVQLQTKAIQIRNIEISKLRAEVDLLTQAVRRNEHIVDWLDDVTRSTDSEPAKENKRNRFFARIRSVFS